MLPVAVAHACTVPSEDGFPGVHHELEHVLRVGDDGIGRDGGWDMHEGVGVVAAFVFVRVGWCAVAGAEAAGVGIVVNVGAGGVEESFTKSYIFRINSGCNFSLNGLSRCFRWNATREPFDKTLAQNC